MPTDFSVHSMHCYFVLAGDATIPVMYYVENVRSGRSFATRTVQARQRGKAIFTTTMSFVRENSGGEKQVKHSTPLPPGVEPPKGEGFSMQEEGNPFESRRVVMPKDDGVPFHERRTRQWVRCKGRISEAGGHRAHINALAYMSDSYFIGTVSRIHNLWRFSPPDKYKTKPKSPEEAKIQAKHEARENKLKEQEGFGDDLNNESGRPEVGMMVSLDHSIYFHEPRKFRADEWMFTEMESPWSGDGRGVVVQKMFASDGTLIATCFQEVNSCCAI